MYSTLHAFVGCLCYTQPVVGGVPALLAMVIMPVMSVKGNKQRACERSNSSAYLVSASDLGSLVATTHCGELLSALPEESGLGHAACLPRERRQMVDVM